MGADFFRVYGREMMALVTISSEHMAWAGVSQEFIYPS
jgi:hypothetical protein